ncbi:hypothetical protein RFI_27831 [Reticulomyxa filosa]|uniref:Uncharacterized protein n=1 Tax=Reticulomyxa filosa TaxID=46433 RepID=X6M946_RETFI|nr:hypothetical protein RFI_27831 [Reticulomyxa filosa]|eukprot:ETO09545.1 hypothetical protein RFI_27831 [Reticulomyxa filosa]
MRDLSQRLELFVRYEKEGRSEVSRLKALLAETEANSKQRIKECEKHSELIQAKLVDENKQLNKQIEAIEKLTKQTNKQNNSIKKKKKKKRTPSSRVAMRRIGTNCNVQNSGDRDAR